MPHCQSDHSMAERKSQDLVYTQVLLAGEEEQATAITSGEVSDANTAYLPQSPLRADSPPMIVSCIPQNPCDEAFVNQEEPEDFLSVLYNGINEKVADLVHFLLNKYRRKEMTTEAEMLECVIGNYQEFYAMIFSEACECMQLVFGIDVKEVDPVTHSYIIANALGLTYDGMLIDVKGMPKTGLLIVLLGIIFTKGNCVSEEVVWKMMNNIGLRAGSDHFIYVESKKLVTEDFVQEGYLEYRQVPHTDPARYEFLWGPRARAETSKKQVLEFFAKIIGTDPTSYPNLYAEALRDEEERAKASIAPAEDGPALRSASPGALAASSDDK